ncbi:PepSY domain-containing protein [Paenibacillus crassostreae]|uniref:PepSY domain-containing protein n=1 Tax=Paenibacillus crassostreae TaxID=1763538 RepID=A0A162N7W7_9BACL|nr:PepSY domain-containing protein [Paenibacillus crassostreae]AOZ93777.1 hypothetical protein LPB68_17325 [Paenibacillus crassostreae]OAB71312.1 hypothetical protein PNBC_20195 [Paenibacillus crassostreae]
MKMKQKLGISALVVALSVGGVFGVGSVQASNLKPSNTTQKVSKVNEINRLANAKVHVDAKKVKKEAKVVTIGARKASVIAATYLNGKATEVRLDSDDETLLYEVNVKTTNGIYIVKVDALTGKVLSVEKDLKIGAERASVIAATYLNGEVMKVKLDRENDVLVYEVKVKIDKGVSWVKVDALTGKVLSVVKDQGNHKGHHAHN